MRTQELLSSLHDVLSSTLREYDLFICPDGDISYFSDLICEANDSTPSIRESLRQIKECFVCLQHPRCKLELLQHSCTKRMKDVSKIVPAISPDLY